MESPSDTVGRALRSGLFPYLKRNSPVTTTVGGVKVPFASIGSEGCLSTS
jgi:hypothetical protein